MFHIISGTFKLFLILFWYQEHERNVPDIAQSTHGNRNIFADIRNVPTRPHTVLGMFLLPFSVRVGEVPVVGKGRSAQKAIKKVGDGHFAREEVGADETG